jgi:RNA polymerase sigma-70 factor (family 1)
MGLNRNIEKVLFSRVQEGEEDSFEILFNHYYPRLCAYAMIFVKFPDVAEEIVQETFITIWERRLFIFVKTSFKAYIYRSVHNNCINYLNNKKYLDRNHASVRSEILKQTELNIKNLDTEIIDKIVSDEFNAEFARALESLPQQCREVFLLCRNEKLSYLEAGERLGIAVNTVKTQMKRALMKLRECMEKCSGN